MLIYKITNDVNSKLYIGQTTKTLEERIRNHKSAFNAGSDYPIYQAMREIGWDKFHFTVIAETDNQDTLDELEAYYIAKYDTINNGYNQALGGKINLMKSYVIKEKHDNTMRSEAVRHKISESMKQSYKNRGGCSAEHRAKLSADKKALYASERGNEVREKFRKSYVFTDEHREALNASHYKAVYCINENGGVVAEFNSIISGARWWYEHGYEDAKNIHHLQCLIGDSCKKDLYIKGLKWIYRV